MENSKVAIVVVSFVLLAILLYYFFGGSTVYTSVQSANITQSITASNLPNGGLLSANYSYSIWIYINDWNAVNPGNYKIIFGRSTGALATSSTPSGTTGPQTQCDLSYFDTLTASSSNQNGNFQPCPVVFLGQYENDLGVLLQTFTSNSTDPSTFKFVVNNAVPLQKWVHIVVSVYQTVLDIYIDGKLASTNVLQGTAFTSGTATPNLNITPCGGFSGWTSKMQYYTTPLNPQQVWDLYTQGYGAGYFSNMMNQNGLTLTINKNGIPQSTFTI